MLLGNRREDGSAAALGLTDRRLVLRVFDLAAVGIVFGEIGLIAATDRRTTEPPVTEPGNRCGERRQAGRECQQKSYQDFDGWEPESSH